MAIAERINNAIYALDWRARSPASVPNADVRNAVEQLSNHWNAYWNSNDRRMLPELAQHDKLRRYVEWYARAFALVPKSVRAKVPDPRTIEPSWSALATAQIAQTVDVYRNAAAKGLELAVIASEEAAKLGGAIGDASEKLVNRLERDVLVLGVLVIGGLLAYGYAKKSRFAA